MKNLKHKIATGILGFGISLVSLAGGCTEMTNEQLSRTSTTGRIYATNPGLDPRLRALGALASAGAQKELRNRALSGSRQNSEISRTYEFNEPVYLPTFLKNPPKHQLFNFFTYKKWIDLDKDGNKDNNEFFGVGEDIREGEEFYLFNSTTDQISNDGPLCIIPSGKFRDYHFKLFDPKGEYITGQKGRLELGNVMDLHLTKENVRSLFEHRGAGNYRAVIEIGDRTDVISFTLVSE